jgi:hypothetical protein
VAISYFEKSFGIRASPPYEEIASSPSGLLAIPAKPAGAMTYVLDKINRPSLLRWAIGFLFCSYFSTSKASPNDSKIVIVVIIIVISEAVDILHSDGIIAQRHYSGGVFFL